MTADCTTRPDLDWFSPADYEQAAAVCAGCPVRVACLEGAVARGETWGLWAGVPMDAPDADTFLLDGIPEPVAVTVEHGTRTRRNAGCTCRRCLDAHSAYVREWRERGRADVTGAVGLVPEQLDLFGRTA